MHLDETQRKIRSWAGEALSFHGEFLQLMSPVGKYKGWKPAEQQTLSYLLPACARSSQSALFLVAYAQLWDAEVVVRSAAEGSLKFCYLLQNQKDFEQRHREYSHDLWRIALLKDHRKAEEFLAAVLDPNDPKWKPIRDRLLDKEQFDEITRSYPQAIRRALDSKWGFTGLMGELSRSGDTGFAGFNGLAHSYSIASHIQHTDYVGAFLPSDRERRPDERRNSMDLAHAARLTLDVFTYLNLRLVVAYRFLGVDRSPLVDAWKEFESLEMNSARRNRRG